MNSFSSAGGGPPPLEDQLAALRAFDRIADLWKLTAGESAAWLLQPDRTPPLSDDALDRLSFALGIFQALRMLFPNLEQADSWIRRTNSALGMSALEHCLANGTAGMRNVRDMLYAQLV